MPGLRQNRRHCIAVGLISTGLLFIGPGVAWADPADITIDFIRHAQSVDNAAGIIDTVPPGTGLTPTGEVQAETVGSEIATAHQSDIAGIFSSEELRAEETAAYLAQDLAGKLPVNVLPGLNEIPAGVFEGAPTTSLQGLLYLVGPLNWMFGNVLMPDLGDPSVNGITFDQSVDQAVQTIYLGTEGTGTGTPFDAAFSSEFTIAVWTMMNVENPDFSVLFQELLKTGQLLANTGQVVIEGSPGDWTLVSYDGMPVPADPGLPTDLFVDFRNLIEAPQFALWDIYKAFLGGDPTTIEAALQTGINQVDTALAQFPVAVFDDILGALTGTAAADAGALVGQAFAGL